MPQALTSSQIQQYINQVGSGGVEQARQVYDALNAQGYNYAGWAAGVARGDSITGLSALSFLQGTALMGMGGDACRNLTQTQIDKIRVDMATGYLETLKDIADRSGNIVNRDVRYDETEAFHKTAFENSGLTLDTWTLKTPFDLIRKTQGDAAAERLWEHLRDTGGTGLDAIYDSSRLLWETRDFLSSIDPEVARRAQDWMDHVPGPLGWDQITRFLDIFGRLKYDDISDTDPFTGMPTHDIDPLVNTRYNNAINWVAPRRDPLVLDLDGNGISTSAIDPNAPILFDQDGDGTLTATGWIAAGEAIVVRDLDGNGLIDSGRELFGDSTVLTQGPKAGQLAANGFEALADLDGDASGVSDGKFDSSDVAFSSVKLWQDLNQDGVSQAAELHTFAELGVTSINVSGTASNVNLGGGNTQTFSGSFTKADGTAGASGTAQLAGSLLLANNNFYRQFTDDPVLTDSAQALPQMTGSGLVRDLRPAMSLGTTQATVLQDKVNAFAAATTRDAQMALLDDVIAAWGTTSGHQVNSLYRYNMVAQDGVLGTTDLVSGGFGDIVLTLHPVGLEETTPQLFAGQALALQPTAAGYEVLRQLNVLETFNGTKFVRMAMPTASTSNGAPPGAGINEVDDDTIDLIAGYACQTGATGRFDCEKRGRAAHQSLSNQRSDRFRTRSAHASCSRLVGHKEQGRRMDAAWTAHAHPQIPSAGNDIFSASRGAQ